MRGRHEERMSDGRGRKEKMNRETEKGKKNERMKGGNEMME